MAVLKRKGGGGVESYIEKFNKNLSNWDKFMGFPLLETVSYKKTNEKKNVNTISEVCIGTFSIQFLHYRQLPFRVTT